MTDQITTPQGDANPTAAPAAAAPAPTTPATPAPRSDAEAQQQEVAAKDAANPPAPKPEDAETERKKNRTREYIAKLNRENAEMRERLAQVEATRQPPATPAARTPVAPAAADNGAPTLEQYNFDYAAHQAALTAWAVDQALKQREENTSKAESTKQARDRLAAYNTKAVEFADEHPDFFEAVGSIDTKFLTNELQAAVMAHDNGPAIAYHLANNDDDLWQLASIRPDLMAAAVDRLASRLTATPPKVPAQPTIPAIPSVPAAPVSRTPAPAPTVSGRAPTETPPEKLTDDDWYAKDREKRRKR